MDYELFHDESQISGYWHGILLLPVDKKSELVNLLEISRKNSKYEYPISLKNIQKKGSLYGCAFSWITIGVAALASRFKNEPPCIYLGDRVKGHRVYSRLPNVIGAKFILFSERDCHELMFNYPDHASKVETTFRIGLKGGLHYLGNEEDPIKIVKMHFDGYKHYRRHIDIDRIVNRLNGLRNYCSISDDRNLIDDRSSNHRNFGSQAYEDCQFLQLTDLLVGSFRTYLGQKTNDCHLELAIPVLQIIKRMQSGYARMKNSRWSHGVCMSQCHLESGRWVFNTLSLEINDLYTQLSILK